MTSVKKKHISSIAPYTEYDDPCQGCGCGCAFIGGCGGEGYTFIGGGGCISISICISGADGGGEGSTSSYLAGEEFLSAAILASCAATRAFTVSSSITTQLSASDSFRYLLLPPGFLVK